MTLKERLEEGLRKLRFVEVRHPRSGIRCWKAGPGRPGEGSDVYVFVGTNGGLRMGKSKSDSWSIKDSGFYKQILESQEKGPEGSGKVTDWGSMV